MVVVTVVGDVGATGRGRAREIEGSGLMRARHLGALAAVAALTLSGCGGEDEPVATSTSTPMPTVYDSDGSTSTSVTSSSDGSSSSGSETSGSASGGSSSATSASTEPPEEAQANTKAGAEAFAKWYWEQLNLADTSGKTKVVRTFSSPACAVCASYADNVDKNAELDRRADKPPYTVTLDSSRTETEKYYVKSQVRVRPYNLVDSQGEAQATVESDRFENVLTIIRDDESWLVEDSAILRGTS